ncbi:hypothetical protein DQ04_10621000, partial [Trypanosoma grayi]|uniref:hypothetical protein n=1 Tax=Trypanosoma grayi TaxID=71804 RepID=UPI0004F40225
MSVPFKYRQHIRDIHESFHDGKPISEDELMSVMNIICPAEQQEICAPYRAQCPLNGNSFLTLMYELQKATQIPYEDFVWNYIKGSLKNGLFNGQDHADLKALRTTLDPLMRSVRFDVQNIYKQHTNPDDDGQITIDHLCDVFRAMYPANQMVYIEMYKWARAKKVIKSRGIPSERDKTASARPTPPVAPSAPPTTVDTSSGDVTAAGKAEQDGPENMPTTPAPTTTAEAEATATTTMTNLDEKKERETHQQENLESSPQPVEEAQKLSAEGVPKETDEASLNAAMASNSLRAAAAEKAETPTAVEPQAQSPYATEAAALDTPMAAAAAAEKRDKNQIMLPAILPTTTEQPLSPVDAGAPEEPQRESQTADFHARPLDGVGASSVLVSPSTTMSFRVAPPQVQVERRPGLDFNPPNIRDIEPPSSSNNKSVVSGRNEKPLPKLRAHDEHPSWEYEEMLLDAMLARVVPGKPVDPQVVEYLRELARQEREIQAALHMEMDNLTSNMLACEVVEQRMMALRDQRQARCFDRLETRRSALMAEMDRYVRRVRSDLVQNRTRLGCSSDNDIDSSGPGANHSVARPGKNADSRYDSGSAHKEPGPLKVASVSTPPPLPPSANYHRSALQRWRRLEEEEEEKLQRLRSVSYPAAWATPILQRRPPYQQAPFSADVEFAKRICGEYTPSGAAPQRGNCSNEAPTPRHSAAPV